MLSVTEWPFADLFTHAPRVIQISINQTMKTLQFSSSEIRVALLLGLYIRYKITHDKVEELAVKACCICIV